MGRQTADEVRAGLELALEEILNVQNLNVWISVKDRPIGKILESAGVDKKYNSYVMKALAKCGLVEEEGELAGKMYKIKSQVIPDIKYLVKQIHEQQKAERKPYYVPVGERKEEENKFDGYPESSPSDLRQKRAYKRKDAHQDVYSSQAVKVKRQVIIPNLGDMRFALKDGGIVEGKIISLHYGEDGKSIMYNLEIVNQKWIDWKSLSEEIDIDGDEEPNKYIIMSDVSVKDLFETPQIAADFLIRHTLKYIKR